MQAKEEMMQTWRKERDTLVSALEVQLHKLLSSQSEKDREILELKSRIDTQPTPEVSVVPLFYMNKNNR